VPHHNNIIQWKRSCIAIVFNLVQLFNVVFRQLVFFSTFYYNIQVVRWRPMISNASLYQYVSPTFHLYAISWIHFHSYWLKASTQTFTTNFQPHSHYIISLSQMYWELLADTVIIIALSQSGLEKSWSFLNKKTTFQKSFFRLDQKKRWSTWIY